MLGCKLYAVNTIDFDSNKYRIWKIRNRLWARRENRRLSAFLFFECFLFFDFSWVDENAHLGV